MDKEYREKVHRINCLTNDMDSIYHQAARKLGVSDSVLIVLYMLYDKGGQCRIVDICNESGLSKQTVNSAIRSLESDGVLFLEQDMGRTKRACLTEKGKEYTHTTAARLFEAECRAFESWSEQEFEQHLMLMEKYNRTLRAEVEKL